MTPHVSRRLFLIVACVTLIGAHAAAPSDAPRRPKVVVITAEQEYRAKETLPAFFKDHVQPAFPADVTLINSDSTTDIPGLDALADADLLVLYARRRTLPDEQMAKIRAYLDRGKPLVALRTSSHAFQTWPEFDRDVLGGNYKGHHGKNLTMTVRLAPGADAGPLARGVDAPFQSQGSLYKTSPLATTATPLLIGKAGDHPQEPVAWTNAYKGGRVFYTALGHPADFEVPAFRAHLLNGILWALDRTADDAARE